MLDTSILPRLRLAPALALALALLIAPRAVAQDTAAQDTAAQDTAAQGTGDDAQARIHFEAGQGHYGAGRFADAAREFEAAYALSQRTPLLYNIYLARRDLGDRRGAADAMRRYLAGSPDLEQDERRLHQARLEALDAEIAAEEAAAQAAAEARTQAPTEPAPSGGGIGIVPGAVLLGVGGAALVVALIEGVVAQDVASQYGTICDQTGDPSACPASEAARLDGLASDFELHRGLAWGFFAGGLAIAAAGGALLALGLSEGGSSDAPQAGLGCGPDGCRLSVRGRF